MYACTVHAMRNILVSLQYKFKSLQSLMLAGRPINSQRPEKFLDLDAPSLILFFVVDRLVR